MTVTVTWLVDIDGEVLMVTVVVAGCEVVAANGQELMVYMTSHLSYSCCTGLATVTVVVAGCQLEAANGQELMVYSTSRFSCSCRGGTQPSTFGIQPASLSCSAAANANGADVCVIVTVEEVATEDVEREEANGQSLIVNIPSLFPFSFATP